MVRTTSSLIRFDGDGRGNRRRLRGVAEPLVAETSRTACRGARPVRTTSRGQARRPARSPRPRSTRSPAYCRETPVGGRTRARRTRTACAAWTAGSRRTARRRCPPRRTRWWSTSATARPPGHRRRAARPAGRRGAPATSASSAGDRHGTASPEPSRSPPRPGSPSASGGSSWPGCIRWCTAFNVLRSIRKRRWRGRLGGRWAGEGSCHLGRLGVTLPGPVSGDLPGATGRAVSASTLAEAGSSRAATASADTGAALLSALDQERSR